MFSFLSPFTGIEIPTPDHQERLEFRLTSQKTMLAIYQFTAITVLAAAAVWWPSDPMFYGDWPAAYTAMGWLRIGLIFSNAVFITATPELIGNLSNNKLRLFLLGLYTTGWELWCQWQGNLIGEPLPQILYLLPFIVIGLTLFLFGPCMRQQRIDWGIGIAILVELGWVGGCLGLVGEGVERMFPFMYVAPLFTIALIIPLPQRLFWTLSGTLIAGLSAQLISLPQSDFDWLQLGYLVFTSFISTGLGHIQYRLLMGFFVWRRRLAEKKAELEELNLKLEERIAEQAALLLDLNRQAAGTRLQERDRIARDLHDGLGQDLTATRLVTQATMMGAAPKEAQALGEVLTLLERSHQSLRQALHDLMPTTLEEHGLTVALRQMVEETSDRAGLTYHLELEALPRHLPVAVAVAVFRVAQESLSNVLKHAQASELRVRLTMMQGGLLLEISDNGSGFASNQGNSRGFGLSGIKKRIDTIRGWLVLSSERGTTVRAFIPVSPPHDPDSDRR